MDEQLFESVCRRAREAAVLQTAAETLEWDERTGMPVAAGAYRAEQISALRTAVHRIRTDSQYGDDLQTLVQQVAELDPGSDTRACVDGLHRDWDRNRKLPTELVEKISNARVLGQQIWDQARGENDFSLFRDALANMVGLQREAGTRMAEGTDRDAYDALLDTYEPNAKADDLQRVFDEVRGPLVGLVEEIAAAPKKPPTEILKRSYPVEAQRQFSRFVAEKVGFDFQRGRLDETSHPFCTTLGPHDCRILTRYDEHWLPGGL
ncbi:MAG: carboxypeptidase M32, partial [Pirellulaceae bacterium]|nr:carboxypeptidase M32 [Pirellulaceae bacterium]